MNLKEQKKKMEERLEEINSKIAQKEKKTKTMKGKRGKTWFYLFRQNNSGGYFEEDEDVCINVFVEAHSFEEANLLADDIGIYFDGCSQGIDCSCCGDRWSELWGEEDRCSKPFIHDGNSEKKVDVHKAFKSLCSDKCIIHYLDGRKETVVFKTEADCPGHKFKQRYDIGRKCEICGKWENNK